MLARRASPVSGCHFTVHPAQTHAGDLPARQVDVLHALYLLYGPGSGFALSDLICPALFSGHPDLGHLQVG
jgi:hypothetical protein